MASELLGSGFYVPLSSSCLVVEFAVLFLFLFVFLLRFKTSLENHVVLRTPTREMGSRPTKAKGKNSERVRFLTKSDKLKLQKSLSSDNHI